MTVCTVLCTTCTVYATRLAVPLSQVFPNAHSTNERGARLPGLPSPRAFSRPIYLSLPPPTSSPHARLSNMQQLAEQQLAAAVVAAEAAAAAALLAAAAPAAAAAADQIYLQRPTSVASRAHTHVRTDERLVISLYFARALSLSLPRASRRTREHIRYTSGGPAAFEALSDLGRVADGRGGRASPPEGADAARGPNGCIRPLHLRTNRRL